MSTSAEAPIAETPAEPTEYITLAELLAARAAADAPPRRQTRQLVTALVTSFSLTLLVGSLAVLSGYLPLDVNPVARADLGALLMFAPVCALAFAIVFEAARLTFKGPFIAPEPEPIAVRWVPGDREG